MGAFISQLTIGLINGSFYAILSLGLAVIFGMLEVINFAHGAMFMLGAYLAWAGIAYWGFNYWIMLFLAPLIIAGFGMVVERTLIRRIYGSDYLYGMLLTLGLALVIEEILRSVYGVSGYGYRKNPLPGIMEVGPVIVPIYRIWAVGTALVACLVIWYGIERTRYGAYLRAATHNPGLVETFGINVDGLRCLTYGLGVGLAGFAGVLAAPILQVNPLTGRDLIIQIFAIVVIGGMGSIKGTILVGLGLGVAEGVVRYIYPQASSITVFLAMILVLIVRPHGLFGKPG